MFEIDEGLFVDPWQVCVVKRVGDGQCAVFMKGQSAIDGGFLVNKDALEVATDVIEARQDDDETEEVDEDDPDEDDDEEE